MDTDGERLYIFGGLGVSSKERFNELWIFSVKGTNHYKTVLYHVHVTKHLTMGY